MNEIPAQLFFIWSLCEILDQTVFEKEQCKKRWFISSPLCLHNIQIPRPSHTFLFKTSQVSILLSAANHKNILIFNCRFHFQRLSLHHLQIENFWVEKITLYKFLTVRTPKESPPIQRRLSEVFWREILAPLSSMNFFSHSTTISPDNPNDSLLFQISVRERGSFPTEACASTITFFLFKVWISSVERKELSPRPKILSLPKETRWPEPGCQANQLIMIWIELERLVQILEAEGLFWEANLS